MTVYENQKLSCTQGGMTMSRGISFSPAVKARDSDIRNARNRITLKAIAKLEEMARSYSFKLEQLLLSSHTDNILISLTINLDKSIIRDIGNINFTIAFKDNIYFKEKYNITAMIVKYNAGKLILRVKH